MLNSQILGKKTGFQLYKLNVFSEVNLRLVYIIFKQPFSTLERAKRIEDLNRFFSLWCQKITVIM